MFKNLGKLTVAGAAVLSITAQATAGGYAASCYERTHRPAAYDTVYEKVMTHPGSKQVEVVPAIYGTTKRKVLVQPAQERWNVIPAEYAYQKEKVMIEPERVYSRVIPAVHKTIHRQVMVHEGGHAWEWQIIKGKKVLCKVKRPPVYQTVAETVVVHPERVVHETAPARWNYETRKVMIRPAEKQRYHVPAQYDYVLEQVMIRPAEKRVHHTPPRYETVARHVKVREAESGWRPVPSHCKG